MDLILLLAIAFWLFLAMTGAWAVQRTTGQSGWIDTIWSGAVGFGGVGAALFAHGDFHRRMAVMLLVALWALRLASHIGKRTKGSGEDPRYARLIEDWGDSAGTRLFVFLQSQALAAFVLVLAVYLAASNTAAFPRIIDIFAILLGVAALTGEAVADAQLARFRRTLQSKTEVCETGLWRYSRHPNYFFEWVFWCCWPLLAIGSSFWGWLSLLAPLMIYWLLVNVSGIPPLEQHMLHSRGEKFRALQSRVNAFFPGPRKSNPVASGKQS